jgi:hypothetical protein
VAKLLQDEAAAANGSGYSFVSSWFETLAVASHPLQPDSFIC